MRIAYFSEVFVPKVDGIVTTLRYLLEHVGSRGHESVLFAPASAPPRYAQTRVIGVPGIPMPLYPELRLSAPIRSVSRELDAFKPDIIHLVNPVTLGLAGIRYARRRGVPLVASYHTDLPGFAARWGLSAAGPALWSFIRHVHGSCALNLCPSAETRDELANQGIPNLAVWGRGVDTALFGPEKRDVEWRTRLTGGHPDRPLLLYVGRLSPEKRVGWISECLDALPEARLAIVGDGPARSKLEAQFSGKPAVFTGYLHGEDLARAYAAGDAFVFPGANETLGNVVLEAMASGVPVVAPASGGVLDHVRDGYSGLLFDPESRSSMAGAVRRLVRDPELSARVRANGLDRTQRLSWTAENDRLLARYERVIRDCRQALAEGAAA